MFQMFMTSILEGGWYGGGVTARREGCQASDNSSRLRFNICNFETTGYSVFYVYGSVTPLNTFKGELGNIPSLFVVEKHNKQLVFLTKQWNRMFPKRPQNISCHVCVDQNTYLKPNSIFSSNPAHRGFNLRQQNWNHVPGETHEI